MNKREKKRKLASLKEKLAKYEAKLKEKMIGYRGVVHESSASEIRHNEVMVLRDIINQIKREIDELVV